MKDALKGGAAVGLDQVGAAGLQGAVEGARHALHGAHHVQQVLLG